jgi:predicted nucleotidyltransferase
MTIPAFAERLHELVAAAAAHDEVVGVVGFGSTAERSRADEWSDHDLALITATGDEAPLRRALDWVPHPERVVLAIVDRYDAVTVMWDAGEVLEYGVATLDDFAGWPADRAEALFDRGGVAPVVREMLTRTAAGDAVDVGQRIRIALVKLLVGVGRARRGELLTANRNIRGEALEHLLAAWAAALPGDRTALDTLDPHRRFEHAHPELAARADTALRLHPETAARALLELIEETLGDRADFPVDAATTIRRRLGWDDPRTLPSATRRG